MKFFVYSTVLCAALFLECESLNIGNLFSRNPFQSSSSSVEKALPTAEKLLQIEAKRENVTFSSGEFIEKDTNDESLPLGESSSGELSANFEISNDSLLVDNTNNRLPNKSINAVGSFLPSTIGEISISTQAKASATIESFTPGNHLENSTLTSSENVTLSTEEAEKVVLETKPSTFTVVTRNIYQKTVEWMGDTYTLSILVPIAAGVLFALVIVIIIAFCRCIRRKCRRRRFRKRVLPDSIKSLSPSDKARLLGDCGDSSDEF